MGLSKEQIHDKEIAPMMAKIIAICKENKIAMIASYHLGDDMACTSALLDVTHNPPKSFMNALDEIITDTDTDL